MIEPGRYLGGVRSVECLRQRCHVDDETGCWQWKLYCNDAGTPLVCLSPTIERPEGANRKVTGAFAAYLLSRGGKRPPKGRSCYPRCGVRNCVNPAHIAAWTRAEYGAHGRKIGLWKDQPNRIKACTEFARSRAKLDIHKVREIRASTETITALGQRYGVTATVISRIRMGKAWKDPAANASVFTWAGAA